MASARILLASLGFVISAVGVAVAWFVERFTGMALLIVGGLLLILPFARTGEDE